MIWYLKFLESREPDLTLLKKIKKYIEQNQLKSKDSDHPDFTECDNKLTPISGNHSTFSKLREILI